jgi:hypothetical protein
MRSMVARSHSPARNAMEPRTRSPSSVSPRSRSNLAPASPGTASGSSSSAPMRGRPRPASCRTNIAWKSGVCARLRSVASSSTSRSKGTSWCW